MKIQLDALKKLATADKDADSAVGRIDFGEMYLENLSLLLFGKSCSHRIKDRVYFNAILRNGFGIVSSH